MQPEKKFFLIEKLRNYIQKLETYIAHTQETLRTIDSQSPTDADQPSPREPSDRP